MDFGIRLIDLFKEMEQRSLTLKERIRQDCNNDGDIRMRVTEDEVLRAWKQFFSTGTNWKDVADSYEEYQGITDRQHLSNAKRNPIKFLRASGKGFFVEWRGLCYCTLRGTS